MMAVIAFAEGRKYRPQTVSWSLIVADRNRLDEVTDQLRQSTPKKLRVERVPDYFSHDRYKEFFISRVFAIIEMFCDANFKVGSARPLLPSLEVREPKWEMQHASPLLQMAPEIILKICILLDDEDHIALILTCKALHTFARMSLPRWRKRDGDVKTDVQLLRFDNYATSLPRALKKDTEREGKRKVGGKEAKGKRKRGGKKAKGKRKKGMPKGFD